MQVFYRHLSLERSGILSGTESPIMDEPESQVIEEIEWLLNIGKLFKIDFRSIDLGIEIFNIVIRTKYISSDLRLYTMTSLIIASKLYEIWAPEIGDFMYISGDKFTEKQIAETEIDIFEMVNYKAYLPIGTYFIRLIVHDI